MEKTLTMVLPDLMSAAHSASLETLLSRARSQLPLPEQRTMLLLGLFDATSTPEADVSLAAVTWGVDSGELPPRELLRADPVYLVADRDVLRLLHHADLPVTAEEAQALVAALNSHFATDGLHFAAPHPQRWYLTIPKHLMPRTHPPEAALGLGIDAYLPWGDHATLWHRHLNEIQMLLHSHPVNAAREQRGQPVINSVWLWGGGSVPAPAQRSWAQVWSDDPVTLGLAKLSATPRTAQPTDANAWLDAAITPGDHLLVLPHHDEEFATNMEILWFMPLLDALKSARLQQLTLCTTGHRWSIDRTASKRWWVRRRALPALLQANPA